MIAGVIGYGLSGRLHASGYLSHPDVERVVVFDAAEPDVSHSGATVARDMAEFWSATPTAVSVCTPPSSHGTYVLDALAHGAHVLCEKPLAFRSADVAPWIAAAERRGRILGAAFAHRFFAPTRRLRRLIESGALGTTTFCLNRFAVNYQRETPAWKWDPAVSGGGAIHDTLLHSVDLYRYLFGEPADLALTTSSALPERFGPVEDGAVALVSGPGPMSAALIADWTTPTARYELKVYGTRGWAVVDFDPPRIRWCTADAGGECEETFPGTALERFFVMTREFVDALQGARAFASPIAEGVRAMAAVEGARALRGGFVR